MQSVEADREAGGAGHAVSRREHSCGVENQQGVREIARTENADGHQQAAKRWRQSFEAEKERARRLWPGGAFADEQPEARDGDEARQKRPEKNFAIRMAPGFEKP